MKSHTAFIVFPCLLLVLLHPTRTLAYNVVLAGGTGPLGAALASKLYHDTSSFMSSSDSKVTILCRNAFLARAPARASGDFGWVGQSFMQKHSPIVQLRDWDGGDLLDIVGKDWIGWQQDALANANVIVHLVGGFTQQRVMACERLVREAHATSPKSKRALHITVNPTNDDLTIVSPMASLSLKIQRIQQCEDMVRQNCLNYKCLRLEANRVEEGADQIFEAIREWAEKQE
jgi:hypothetical protein